MSQPRYLQIKQYLNEKIQTRTWPVGYKIPTEIAGRRLADMAENTRGILAVELLASAQGLDFRAPNKSSERIEEAKSMLRERVDFYDKDVTLLLILLKLMPCYLKQNIMH